MRATLQRLISPIQTTLNFRCCANLLPLAIASISLLFAQDSGAAGYRNAVMADGPIAYWRFSDAPPTANNSGSMGAAANGTYNGTATSGAEAPRPPAFIGFEGDNSAVQLDGASGFVSTLGSLLNSRPVFTISGWMRRNGDQAGRTGLWGQNDIVEFGYIANQTLEVWTDNGLDIPNAIPNAQWAHLAMVSEGSPGTMSMYTNGVLAGSRAHTLPGNNAFAFNIGGGGVFDGTGNFFNGQIDEVAIFDTALTAAQIAAQYAGAFTPLTPLPNVAQLGRNRIGTATNSAPGSFTIVGGGNDIWDNVDEFTYNYTEVTGDFDVKVRVESLEPSARWSKAGLMVRETLAEDSRMIFNRVTPLAVPTGNGGDGANDTRLAYRTGRHEPTAVFGDDHNGGRHEDIDAANTIPAANLPNGWLRLVRRGNVFFASNSVDGISWQFVSTQDTSVGDWVFSPNNPGPFTNSVLVGLGVSRHSGSNTAKAEFRDFDLVRGSAGSFAVLEASSRGNPNGVRVSFNGVVGAGGSTPANYTLGVVSGPNVTVVTGLRFTAANDSPERDPMTFTLEGTTGDPAVGDWTLIASGDTGLATDPGRNTVGPIVPITNTNGYRAYRLLFPTVRDVSANSMQIAEIELLDVGGVDVTAPGDTVVGVRAIAGNSLSEVAVAGTTGGANNYPAAESPDKAIDGVVVGSKYLNFAEVNTGIIVSPTGGSLPTEPTVSAAVVGSDPSTVWLTTSRLVEGATYVLSAANVLGADGTALGNDTGTFVHGAGYEPTRIRLARNMIPGANIDLYLNSLAYQQDIPTASQGFPAVGTNTVFEDLTPSTGDGQQENYSMRLSGVLVAPTTGNYTFYMSSDDFGRLFLSTDANPANKVEIAREPEWNGGRQWLVTDRRPNQENISAPQALQAGGRYYLELIFSEGGGGNFGAAAWLPPGGPAVANGSLPIPESAFTPTRQFGGAVFSTLGPVRIVSSPATQSVTALTPTTFRVVVDGTPRYTYQWRRNGQPIAGATGPIYTIPATPLSDDQAVFSVSVANEFSSANSANATLTVQNPVPPHLVSASADSTFTAVFVQFDNRLEVASAQNPLNYTISGGVTVNSATRDATGRGVVLAVSLLTSGVSYTLTVRDLHDETGTTTLIPNPSITNFTGWILSRGVALMEVYLNVTGNAVADLTGHPSYPNSPSERYSIGSLDSRAAYPNDSHEGYGGRISALFRPSVTGDQIFYLRSDDASELWLSTDSDPVNKVKIQEETACCNAFSAHASAAIPLVGGQNYYLELLWKEGTGGDFGQVSIDGTSPVSGQYLIGFANPDLVSLVITQQPQTITRTVNGLGGFTVGVSLTSFDGAARTLYYQWRSNGVNIVGANSASYITPPLTLANEGDVYSVEVSTLGASLTSANAIVHVVPDNVPPVLVNARGNGCNDGTLSRIFLNWSELMSANAAEEEGSYRVFAPGLSDILVTLATLVNGTNVVLDLATPMVGGGVYSVEAGFQTDLVGNQTVKVGNPTVDVARGVVISVAFSLGFGTNASGQIVIEAENYGGIDSPVNGNSWLLGTTPVGNGSISGNYMFSNDIGNSRNPPLNGVSPRLDYCVNLPVAGTWYVWARGCGIDGAANSVHVGIDGTDSPNGLQLGNFNGHWDANTWNWTSDTTVSPAQFSVASAGVHTFNVWMREDGVRVDRFLLTQDPAFTFAADRTVIGPAETPLGGSGSVLTISRSGGQITISWSGPLCLQEADQVTGPWGPSTRVNGTPFTPPATGNKFYRLATCPP